MNLEAYYRLRDEVGSHVKIIAVSKKQPDEKVRILLETGHRDFGENYVQDLTQRYTNFKESSARWHFIGHLQTNKVKYIVPFINLIQSVDSLKLLSFIDKEAQKNFRQVDCLLQIYIAKEETKFGLNEEEALSLIESKEFSEMKHIRIIGVMGMASLTDNVHQIRKEFHNLYNFFSRLKTQYFNHLPYFKEISMGMSDDYRIAIEEGSTMIRVGTLIFGRRENT